MKLRKKIAAAALSAVLSIVNAASLTANTAALGLTYDGIEYSGILYLNGDTAYVGARSLSEAANAEAPAAEWNGSRASFKVGSTEFEVTDGSRVLRANGRTIEMSSPAELSEGRICLPVRAIAGLFGAEVEWDKTLSLITLTTVSDENASYDKDELDVMARIISAESCNEPYAGKLMVGSVIMNRVRSSQFPSTVREVVYDRRNGIQFTPTANGAINNTPCNECVKAAKAVLSGRVRTTSALYFVNTSAAPNSWAERNRPFLVKIGSHSFFT